MNEAYETKKYGADKLALLALFILALFIARMIVASRTAIILSESIELTHTGLSLSVPVGNGWRSDKKWKHQENGFTLSSGFGSTRPTALVECRYLLAAESVPATTRFEQEATAIEGQVIKTDQMYINSLPVNWAHIKKQDQPIEMFFATMALPNGRYLEIKVYSILGDTDMAESVFKAVAESIKFKDNKLLSIGSEIVAEIKNIGVERFLHDLDKQIFFQIADTRGQALGFTMNVFIGSDPQSQLNVQAASLFYIKGPRYREQVTFFQSDNSFDQFNWKSETKSKAGIINTETILDQTGIMTIKTFTRRVKEESYQLGPAAIPDMIFEIAFSHMIYSGHQQAVLDLVAADGTITPILVSKIETENTADQAAYAFDLEFLNAPNLSQQIYLDARKQVIKKVVKQEKTYILERTSIENIIAQFPEKADYILQKSKILQESQP